MLMDGKLPSAKYIYMPIIIKNYCDGYRSRITNHLIKKIARASSDLNLGDWETFVYFLDWDPDWSEYRGGWHEYGKDGSIIQVEVAPPRMTPHIMLYWLACHELRHAHQTKYDMFNEEENLKVVEACLKQDGLTKPNQAFMRKWHDTFPEEVDAHTWANTYTQFDGARWWNDVIEARKKATIAIYRLKK